VIAVELIESFPSDLKIYPNPSNDFVIAEFPLHGSYDLLITNSIGGTISENIVLTKIKKGTYKIDTTSLPEEFIT